VAGFIGILILSVFKHLLFGIIFAVKFENIASLVERDGLSPVALGTTTKARTMHSPGNKGRATW
jgi:hypothetical protein